MTSIETMAQALQSVIRSFEESAIAITSSAESAALFAEKLIEEINKISSDPDYISIALAYKIVVTEFGYDSEEKTKERLRKAARTGAIDAIQIGSSWQIDRRSLYQWLENPSAHKPGPKGKNK